MPLPCPPGRRGSLSPGTRALFVLAFILGLGACKIEGYRLGETDAALPSTDGRAVDAPRLGPDAGPSFDATPGCVAQAEICDGLDNDCDGTADNGFNFLLDPQNCGECGKVCNEQKPHERGSCVEGTCRYTCASGYLDCSPTEAGCEYPCIPTNGGEETCDGLDNDCDCQLDEGFNTQTDPLNCGSCRHVCVALHAAAVCNQGICGTGTCEQGYQDVRQDIPGCEYRCPVFPAAASDATCDGVDDDCDGQKDEDVSGVGQPCATGAMGECGKGVKRCVGGSVACVTTTVTQPELCDNLDNDCNGAIDNGFDKLSDPAHCGGTCQACAFPHGIPACDQGICKLLQCEPGYADLSPSEPGCEYACSPSGPEVCDGVDNDCDGLTDEQDPDLIRPTTSFCALRGACANVTLRCGAPAAGCGEALVAWRCTYPPIAETDSCGNLVAQEALCDGRDGDCDGMTDDAYPQINTPCDDGAVGECRARGTLQCDPGDVKKQKLTCAITQPGAAATDERCNGKDDDCDGEVDNDAADDLVHVQSGALDFWMYMYEASRPDATATTRGSSAGRACSQAGVQPWSLVTWTEAQAACTAAGKRLCTEAEWMAACKGVAKTAYPYGASYDPQACNGNDNDPDCAGADDDLAQPTGKAHGCPAPSSSRCVSSWGGEGAIFDLSGNVREWTSTQVGEFRRIRGGAFDNVGTALACAFDFWAQEEASYNENLGFRCCANQGDL